MVSFKHWKHYLKGVQYTVKVFSNHNNLKYFLIKKTLTWWQVHWAEMLSGFNFVIKHYPGLRNPADSSNYWANYKPTNSEAFNLVPFFKLSALGLYTLTEGVNEEEPLLSYIIINEIQTCLQTDVAFKSLQKNLTQWDDIWFYNKQIYVPDNTELWLKILRAFHNDQLRGHLGRNKTIFILKCWF